MPLEDVLTAEPPDSSPSGDTATGVVTPAGTEGLSPFLQNLISNYGDQLGIKAPAAEPDAAADPAAATPATEPTTTATTEPPAEPTATETLDVFAEARDFGIPLDGKYKDQKSAVQGLLHAAKKIGERDERAQLGQLLMENPALVAQQLASMGYFQQQQPEPEPQPQAQSAADETPSDFKLEWLSALEAKANIPESTKKEITAWVQAKQVKASPVVQTLQKQLDDLRQQISQLGQKAPPQIDHLAQQVHDLRQNTFVNDVLNRHGKDWVKRDDFGNPVEVTPLGYQIGQALTFLKQSGVNDMQTAVMLAEKLVSGTKPTAAPPPPAKTPGLMHSPDTRPSPAVQIRNIEPREGETLEAFHARVAPDVQKLLANQAG